MVVGTGRNIIGGGKEKEIRGSDGLGVGVRFGFGRRGVEWVEWVEWSGVEWNGVEWSGVERSGSEWSGAEWSGVERSGVG